MFHVFLPTPTIFTAPALQTGLSHEEVIVPSLDVSGFRRGVLKVRVHGSTLTSPLEVTLRAYDAWPYDITGDAFQATSPVLETDVMSVNTLAGELITSGAAVDLDAAMVRIAVRFYANGGASAAKTITLSAGLLLLAD